MNGTASYETVSPGSQYRLSTSAPAVPNYGGNEPEFERMLRELTARRLAASRRALPPPAPFGAAGHPMVNRASPASHGGSIFASNAAAEGTGQNMQLVPVGLGAQMIPGMGADVRDPRQRPNASVVGGFLPPSGAGVTPSLPARSAATPADDWYSLPEFERTQRLEDSGYGASRDIARRQALADYYMTGVWPGTTGQQTGQR